MSTFSDIELENARVFLRNRQAAADRRNAELFEQATRDARTIIDMIIERYTEVNTVYQWGSLLHKAHFKKYSDIDIAVSGKLAPSRYFSLLGDAQSLTLFPVDIVQMEKIEPEYAEEIRQYGKVVYERNE